MHWELNKDIKGHNNVWQYFILNFRRKEAVAAEIWTWKCRLLIPWASLMNSVIINLEFSQVILLSISCGSCDMYISPNSKYESCMQAVRKLPQVIVSCYTTSLENFSLAMNCCRFFLPPLAIKPVCDVIKPCYICLMLLLLVVLNLDLS